MRLAIPAVLISLLLTASSVTCMSAGRAGHGFIGYGISMYKPTCAYACQDVITNPLNCTVTSDSHNHGHMRKRMGIDMDSDMDMDEMLMGDGWMVETSPSPECYTTNDAFLQSLAYCMLLHCTDERNSTLQEFWELNVAGRLDDQPLPVVSYIEALQAVNDTPPLIANTSVILHSVGLVPEDSYLVEFRTLMVFEKVETAHERYGLVLLLTGAIIPIGLSFLRFLSIPAPWSTHFEALFITPPLLGSRHNIPYLWSTFTMPTRGQSLFIVYQITINVILCGVGIESARPSSWFPNAPREIVSYLSNRAGVLSFANIPLLVLFSSRNNVLLWVTNWSHGTFLLLHRWIAVIAVIEACLHSAIYLQIYAVDGNHTAQSKLPYWFWGIIATLSMAVILPASLRPVREKYYEIFLAWHVFFFLLTLIGCFLHIYYRYAWQWGYENWIYLAFATWGFDRTLRVLKVARNGVRKMRVTLVDEDYVKLEIAGVRAEGHVYLYFPTLTWRVWENHPFSVLTDLSRALDDTGATASASAPASDDDIQVKDKQPPLATTATTTTTAKSPAGNIKALNTTATNQHHNNQTLTIYLRIQTGLTSLLPAQTNRTLPVLIESSYPPPSVLFPNPYSSPTVLAFAGGVGITALVTPLLSHQGNHKLFWAMRSRILVESIQKSLAGVGRGFGGLNASVFVSAEREEKMDILGILREEVKRYATSAARKGGGGRRVMVVVCGPPGMSDEVRMGVGRVAEEMEGEGVDVGFWNESFGW
ncbi:ferric reductase like transmembrane component-domain-containing protein [Aspergillus spectabilis]